DAKDRTEPLRRVYAHGTFITGVATVLGAVITVPITLATTSSAFWLVKAVFCLIATFIAYRWMTSSEPERTMSEFEALKHAFAHLKSSPSLRWAIGVQASTGLFGAFNMYWALVLLTKINEIQLSWVWALMYSALALAGWLVRSKHGAGLSGSTGMLLSLALGGIPMMLFGIAPTTIVWLILLVAHEVGRGSFEPFVAAYVAERVESGYRATYGSLQSFIGSLGMVLTLIVSALHMSAYDSNLETILNWWLWIGLTTTVVTAILWRFRPKVL
ncbi:MAG: hypothetical protein AAB886_02095, partial [Patescibacteria group bacterium]